MKRKPYRLYDVYEGAEFLGSFDTMEDVRRACMERDRDTDGEWFPRLYYRADGAAKSVIVEDWTY